MEPTAYYDLEDTDWLAHSGTGAAYAISGDVDHDVVAALHAVVEEVTGRPVVRPARRIGFL